MAASALSPTTGQAAVTAPTTGGPFTSYALTVCEKATPANCVTQPDCAAANIAACPLTNLTPATTYTVVAVGKASGIPNSPPSVPAEFDTPIP